MDRLITLQDCQLDNQLLYLIQHVVSYGLLRSDPLEILGNYGSNDYITRLSIR